MRNVIATAAGSALLLAATSATAGQFEIWTDPAAKGNRIVLMVSFAGDGMTEDAQADISYDPALKLVSAQTKVAGSVCVGLPGRNIIRVVPPTGAGTALTSAAVDYCSFVFERPAIAKSVAEFKVEFVECGSPTGMHSCGTEIFDVSVK
jgi:hypothetical protein